jgi:predicted nucleotidyltransferase
MLPTPYPELNAVLDELVTSARRILKDNFVAAALQGSFAVGDFDRHSDVDWVVVIERELLDAERSALQTMHERIYDLGSEWAKHLEGSYIPRSVLRDYTRSGAKVWYLDHGSRELERSDHDNTIVVRWSLREKGVALAGPLPAELIDPIPVEALRREILAVINDWGAEILADPERINNRFYQTFAVLSYCRMLHDLRRGEVGSKRAGAEWAKTNLDPSWSDLIDRAWEGRPNPALSVRQPADPVDLNRTLVFVKEVIEMGNEFAASIQLG